MAKSKWKSLIPFRQNRNGTISGSSEQRDSLEEPNQEPNDGLQLVAQGDQPVVDIVAVHGLNGHREKTWTAANNIHWLRTFLPKDIVNARVYCWGYDANTHGDRVSCQYLYDHAKQLVSNLELERRLTNTTRRPIIFVAHSLGGIIVKSALIHSDAARKGALEQHRSIKISTYGIIFMGTPHQGGNGVQLGRMMINVASVFVAADDRLIKHLERDSEWLQQQLGQFGPISGDFVTKFAYEAYKTRIAGGQSIMVVPKASAVVPGAPDAEHIAILEDHINMVKFQSEENNGYKTVSGHLQIMVKSAGDVIALRWEQEDRVNEVRFNSKESFDIVFSLSGVFETGQFVARQEELDEMHKSLVHSVGRQAVTLHGLGGIGKTQLAIAYAKAHRDAYSAVFWLNIQDEASVKRSYYKIARRIQRKHPTTSQLGGITEDTQLDEAVSAVKRWLERAQNTRWLMVFDNYDNPKYPGNKDTKAIDIQQYLPEAYHGSVIVTTKSSRVNEGRRIKIGKMNVHNSLQILSNSSHREGVMDDPDAFEIAKELDGLPLALATAGAYLDQVSTSFSDYLRLYKKSWLKLHQTSPRISSDEDKQLYSTWQLSLDNIMKQNMHSAKLLELWAYFDNQDLWLELLQEGRSSGPEWFNDITKDEICFNEAARVLCQYGLAEGNNSTERSRVGLNGYGMHSCVHSWTVHVLNQEWNSDLAELALECVGKHIPHNNVPNFWETQRRILGHTGRCWEFILDGKLHDNVEKSYLDGIANMYQDQEKHKEAEKMYQRALQGYEKAWGPEHTSTLVTVNNLGNLYKNLGRLDEAEKMYQRALQGRNKV